MANLYLTEQGAVLRKTGKRLVVTRKDEVILEVPCHQIDAVLLFGGVHFTTPAVRQLSDHGIALALLSRRGKLVCRLAPPLGKNVPLRLMQFERGRDPNFTLAFGRAIVAAKLANSRALVQQHAGNYGTQEFRAELDDLDAAMRAVATVADLAGLLGIEGNAARSYFAALRKMLRVPIDFPARERRPPPDPVNALLSLGYSMLFHELASLIEASGFDPYIGFLHQPAYGRQSLAADVVEEFRAPVADRLALRLLNQRQLTLDHFEPHPNSGAVLLSRDGMRIYAKEYQATIGAGAALTDDQNPSDLRDTMRRQVGRLVRAVMTGAEYEPYRCST